MNKLISWFFDSAPIYSIIRTKIGFGVLYRKPGCLPYLCADGLSSKQHAADFIYMMEATD